MLSLPPVAPTVETVTSVRLGRDYYVRVAGNDYSVDPSAIGQLVDVRTTLDPVTVSRAGRLLAGHDRCWAARQTLTDPTHVAGRRGVAPAVPARPTLAAISWCGIWPTTTAPSESTSSQHVTSDGEVA